MGEKAEGVSSPNKVSVFGVLLFLFFCLFFERIGKHTGLKNSGKFEMYCHCFSGYHFFSSEIPF